MELSIPKVLLNLVGIKHLLSGQISSIAWQHFLPKCRQLTGQESDQQRSLKPQTKERKKPSCHRDNRCCSANSDLYDWHEPGPASRQEL